MKSASIAIVGLGPRGLNILERLSALLNAGYATPTLTLHLIDPAIPGQGVHEWSQPQHLLVNTVAGQITMYSDDTVEGAGPVAPGPSFLDWVRARGYRCVDGKYIVSSAGLEIGENDYLPRSLLGEYLTAVYDRLIASFPANVTLHNHRREVKQMTRLDNGKLALRLDGDYLISADFCCLALGHCKGRQDEFDRMLEAMTNQGESKNSRLRFFRNPYPIAALSRISPADRVAICGAGLSATDVVSALTSGMGGRFEADAPGHVRYLSCGREPAMHMFSRQGVPFGGRAVNQKGVGGQYKARFFTRDAIDAARHRARLHSGSSQLDFDRDVWPVLKLEMAYVHECTQDKQWLDPRDYRPAPASLQAIDTLVAPLDGIRFATYADYQQFVQAYLRQDIADALEGNVENPRKAAADVIRDVRDNIRYAVDHCGLTPESHRRFLSHWCAVMNRIAVGPPKERNMELLALCEAGLLEFGMGPNPAIGYDGAAHRYTLSSTAFAQAHAAAFDVFVRAKIDVFEPEQSTSALIEDLLASGLAAPFRNGAFKPSGLAVSPAANLIDATGCVVDNVWALGNIAEGPTFYTYVLPRPQVNSRAIQDAGKVALAMLDKIGTPAHSLDPTASNQSQPNLIAA